MKTLFRSLLPFVVVSVITFGTVVPCAGAVPEVRANGLRIVDTPHAGKDQMRAFNWFAGTTVALVAIRQNGGIIELDRESSKLTDFKDDMGRDLLTVKKLTQFSSAGFELSATISDSGDACLFEVKAPAIPAKGAKKLTVAGEVALRIGSSKTTDSVKNIALKTGSIVKAGPITLKVSKSGKPGWTVGDYVHEVVFESERDLSEIAKISFLTSDGNPIEATRTSTARSGFFGNMKVTWTYQLKKRVDAANIMVTRWTDLKTEQVPFEVSIGLGL